MKSKLHFLIFLLYASFLISCSGKKLPVSNFSYLSEPVSFNGTYFNEDDKLAQLFNLERDKMDFITIEYSIKNKDTLNISYYTENGLQHKKLKGKFKDNFFEIYFYDRRIYIPIIYTIHNVDRLRVGAAKNTDLLLYKWFENFGMVALIIAGGSISDEEAHTFSKFNYTKSNFLVPFQDNGKWGFHDNDNRIVIDAKYDFVRIFHNDIARVKLHGKWGLINKYGESLTEMKYDEIFQPSLDLMRVVANGKIGYINTKGKEIIPTEYDEIDYLGEYRNRSVTKKDDKYGYATTVGVLSPPVFDKANEFSKYVCFMNNRNTTFYGKVKYKGEVYLVDEDGYMFKYKCSPDKLTLFEETKIYTKELEK